MSRVGRKPIPIPPGTKVQWQAPQLTVSGPKGSHVLVLPDSLQLSQSDSTLQLERKGDDKHSRALHGTYRALIQNALTGVSTGFQITLEVVGIGYRAELKGSDVLVLTLGFSHEVAFVLPAGIKAQVVAERGQNLRIVLEGTDKQLVGQVAAMIRSLRPPDPYKGKGIRYADEVIRLKAGKAKGKGKK